MSVLDGPGEGTWSVFAAKVVEERDELRHKLAGEAAHIKSLEGLLVDAVRERDEARRDLGEILAVIHRDGGHYTGEHGISRSVADAHAAWAAVMRQLDEVASRARRACQVLVAEIGADGPADVDAAAERAASEIRDLRDQVDDLRTAQEESEHQMHLRIRSGYDKTIADSWRAKVAEVEAERDEARAALARTDRARRDSENAWEEEYDAMKRERDEARAHTSTAAFMRIEKQRDEALKQARYAWERHAEKDRAYGDALRELHEARAALGAAWTTGGVSLAEGIRRKTVALEKLR